jgi:FkbM family methyltransferase
VIDIDRLPTKQSLLGRVARLPLRLIPRGTTVRILSGPTAGMRWIVGSGPHSCWLGINEVDKRRLFVREVQPGDIVFDIGANVGTYTLLASALCGPAGKVFAFELQPENLAYLRRHIEINGLTNTSIMPIAVWDEDGTSRFEPAGDRVTSHLSPTGSLEVDCHRIDTMVAAGTVPEPDCIKIDVEGAEAAVLRGCERLLARKRPVIFLATHGDAVAAECADLLRRSGYDVTPIEGMRNEFTAHSG